MNKVDILLCLPLPIFFSVSEPYPHSSRTIHYKFPKFPNHSSPLVDLVDPVEPGEPVQVFYCYLFMND